MILTTLQILRPMIIRLIITLCRFGTIPSVLKEI